MDWKQATGRALGWVRGGRPCTVCAFEALHLTTFAFGLWVTPEGMLQPAILWFTLLLITALAISRLRLAPVSLLLAAGCIGFLIYIPMGALFYIDRLIGSSIWGKVRLGFVLLVALLSLILLWSRKTTRWLREGGGRFSWLAF